MVCKQCGAQIDDNVTACPECGKNPKKGRWLKDVLQVTAFVVAVVIVLAIVYVVAYSIAH